MADEKNRPTSSRRAFEHDDTKADAVTVARLEERIAAMQLQKAERDREVDQRFDDVREDVRDLRVGMDSQFGELKTMMSGHIATTNRVLAERDVANDARERRTTDRLDKIMWIAWVQSHFKLLGAIVFSLIIIGGTISNFSSMAIRDHVVQLWHLFIG